MTFWLLAVTIVLGIFLGAEGFALVTKERWFPTLSRTLWRKLGFEDRSFDEKEVLHRWIVTAISMLFFTWLTLHIAWGPCAFNWC